MTRENVELCRTCHEPLTSDEQPPHCASCTEYWRQIERALSGAKIDRSVAERLRRTIREEA